MNIDHLLNQWRDEVLSDLDGHLEKLFEASADVMLEYAEKAQSDHIRVRFYEALREIRLHSTEVSEHILSGLSRIIFRFDANIPPQSPGRDDVLSLVAPEDFEHGLAMKTIAEHIERDHGPMLHNLSLRLAVVNGGRRVSLDDIPAGPRQLVAQFSTSTALLQIEHEARLALYTLFERFILKETIPAVVDLDQRLAEQGVLPNLKGYSQEIKRQPGQQQAATAKPDKGPEHAAEAAPEQTPAELGDEVLLRIRDLLAVRRAKHRGPSAGTATSNVPPAPVSEVIDAIGALPGSPAPYPDSQVTVAALDRVSAHDLREVSRALSSQREQVREQIGEERVNADIDDIIEIIGAIFEIMLSEENLSNEVKALLSHLHTPYLKFGVTDARLLEDSQHPARLWFDEMIRAGSEWVDPSDLEIGLYPWMSKAVLQVMNAPRLTRELFDQLSYELARERDQIRQQQRSMDHRATEHAKGKARLDHAQQVALKQKQQLILRHPDARMAEGFLEEIWSDYLSLILLRSGNELATNEVRQALAVGEHICVITASTANTASPDTLAIDKLHALLDAEIGELIPHLKPGIRRFIHALKKGQARTDKDTEKATPGQWRKQQTPADDGEALTPQEAKIAASLSKLPPGTRFWRKTADGQGNTTIRLVWLNPQTTKFLVVDLAGQHPGMVPIKELASEIAQGRARVLEEQKESFFEKALGVFQALLKQGG